MVATAEEALRWVDRLYAQLDARRPDVEKSFDYLEGKQPLAYATEQWRKFHAERYKGFADNWCGVVARSPVDRLRIDGITASEGGSLAAEERQLWRDLQVNDFDSQSKQGFLAATTAKRSFTLVWGDGNDEPVISWEHPAQAIVAYDSTGRARRAGLKAWFEDGWEYATLYLPSEVWKFRRPKGVAVTNGVTRNGLTVVGTSTREMNSGGKWEPYQPQSDDTWPLANPLLLVPLVEWQNRPLLGQEPISDIAGTMAMQDAVNQMWAYLFSSADHASMPARVITGAEPPKAPILDENGQVVGSRPAKLEDLANGRFMYIKGDNAKIDQWDAARLDVFTGVITEAISHIAAQTSTPGHYLLSNEKFANLNGDALTAAETPLAKKVESAQEFYNAPARETARLVALVRDQAAFADDLRAARIQWKDAAMHSLSQVSDAAMKDRAVGISLHTVLEQRYGMSPEEIDREMQRIREEQADPVLMALAQGARDDAAAADF